MAGCKDDISSSWILAHWGSEDGVLSTVMEPPSRYQIYPRFYGLQRVSWWISRFLCFCCAWPVKHQSDWSCIIQRHEGFRVPKPTPTGTLGLEIVNSSFGTPNFEKHRRPSRVIHVDIFSPVGPLCIKEDLTRHWPQLLSVLSVAEMF